MAMYYSGEIERGQEPRLPYSYTDERGISLDRQLEVKAERACKSEGIDYKGLEPIQRLFLTHYRCPMCKLVPLHQLNLTYPKRVRCGKCGQLVNFRNTGRWGKMRKKIALQLMVGIGGVR